jgi:hypothetical protein
MAASGNQTNIAKYLLGNNSKVASKVNTVFQNTKTSNTNAGRVSGGIGGSGIGRIVAYLLAIIVVVFVILLFIHYFIKPVFRLRPGSPGIITVPGFDDGKLFWNNTNPGQILNKDLPISQSYFNYSMIMDMFIQNPLQFSKYPRVLFSRGAVRKEMPSGDTMLGVLNNYNLVIALLPDTNDLIVSVLNKDNNMENVIISNVPVQEPFRIGIVVMEMALEVYLNGRLVKTRPLAAPPKDVRGDIFPASGVEANIAKLRNLKIWQRILTTAEIRYAKPPLSTVKEFSAGPIPGSTSCVSSVLDRLDKLSADTLSDVF